MENNTPNSENKDEFSNLLLSIDKKNQEIKIMETIKKEVKELQVLIAKVESKKLKIKKLTESANLSL
ncbi:hypothetical protein LS66_009615 [Helicobacter sp. MIT 03-1614]|uniref:hypothetical protein n=1 Tax=Helicobacter TaxID=209 RepID=UPI000513612E|nr:MULTISPECIES: hypothetical protein [Helicobacter]MDE7235600.1 hypothetical protein [Helicobacter japonicus]TLD86270.1 hypothetical protein LS66_009615 [Helicobacter sp. MIT 03-1614]TLD89720.1 hypothetical protein LS67_001440 [Helicobacter sp. MIT 03-1616]